MPLRCAQAAACWAAERFQQLHKPQVPFNCLRPPLQVTGNRDVPAGQQAWVALAAPIPPPWRPVDQEAVALFQARWSEVERAGSELQVGTEQQGLG